MPINLQEIRTAVQTYLDTRVTVSISTLTPESGLQIAQNEGFCFQITVRNADPAFGGIALKNVRYYLKIENPAAGPVVGKLVVPPTSIIAPMIARPSSSVAFAPLTPGTQVDEMYLFPSDGRNYLDPGETAIIGTTIFSNSILKGRSGTPATGSMANIKFKVLAEVDMDYLFPKNEDTPTASRILTVTF